MAGMINQLIQILQEQTTRCEELLGLAQEKKDVIIKNEIDELTKITNLENMVISQNNRLERQRNAIAADIAEVLGKRGAQMDIAALLEAIKGQAEEDELRKTGEKLRTVLHDLKEANDLNNVLIENSLDYIEYSLNLVRTGAELEGPEYPGAIDARQ